MLVCLWFGCIWLVGLWVFRRVCSGCDLMWLVWFALQISCYCLIVLVLLCVYAFIVVCVFVVVVGV